MPRAAGDRPDVIPDGCVNAAFLGQFAETPRDTIFTTEYSVRTAMEAVYGLCGVDRGIPEVWGSVYDVRELLASSVKLMDGKSPLEETIETGGSDSSWKATSGMRNGKLIFCHIKRSQHCPKGFAGFLFVDTIVFLSGTFL